MKTRKEPQDIYNLYCENCNKHIFKIPQFIEERYYCKDCYLIFIINPIDSKTVIACISYKDWIRP